MALEQPTGVSTAASCSVEVALPMRISDKWVAYACRTAGVAKPKWNSIREVWTTSTIAADGVPETISITRHGEQGARVKVDWSAGQGAARTTSTGRRLVTAIITAMQWALRQRLPS